MTLRTHGSDPLCMGSMADRTRLLATRSSDLHLLRDCLSLGSTAPPRPSARERLEEAVGRDLAARLVTSLTANGYR